MRCQCHFYSSAGHIKPGEGAKTANLNTWLSRERQERHLEPHPTGRRDKTLPEDPGQGKLEQQVQQKQESLENKGPRTLTLYQKIDFSTKNTQALIEGAPERNSEI